MRMRRLIESLIVAFCAGDEFILSTPPAYAALMAAR